MSTTSFVDRRAATLDPGSGIVDSREPIMWLGYEFRACALAPNLDRFEWHCIELMCTLVHYPSNGVWVCRGIAGGPSDSGDTAAVALVYAELGLRSQIALGLRLLDIIDERKRRQT